MAQSICTHCFSHRLWLAQPSVHELWAEQVGGASAPKSTDWDFMFLQFGAFPRLSGLSPVTLTPQLGVRWVKIPSWVPIKVSNITNLLFNHSNNLDQGN